LTAISSADGRCIFRSASVSAAAAPAARNGDVAAVAAAANVRKRLTMRSSRE
jgi:hypothetical protein